LPACAASWTESARHWGAFVGGDADGDVPGDVLALGDVLADPLGFADLVVLVDDPDGLLSGRTLAAAPEFDGAGEAFAAGELAGAELDGAGLVVDPELGLGAPVPPPPVPLAVHVTGTGGATTPRKFSTAAAPSFSTLVPSWPGMSTTNWSLPWMTTVAWVTPVPFTRSARI